MKKILLILGVSCLLLTSCYDALDSNKCLDQVQKTFPNAKIYVYPDNKFKFIVVDNNGVREVTTFNLSNTDMDNVKNLDLIK